MLNFKTLVVIEILYFIAIALFRYALKRPLKSVLDGKVLFFIMSTPAVALFSGNVFIFYAYVFICSALISPGRVNCCTMYAIMIPLMPNFQVETGVGSSYLFRFSYAVVLATGTLLGFIFSKNKKSYQQPSLDLAIAILILIISRMGSEYISFTSISREILLNSFIIGIPYMLFSRGISKKEDFEKVILGIILAATVGSVVSIFEYLKNWALFQQMQYVLAIPQLQSATLSIRGGHLRSGGPMLEFGSFGLFMATALFGLAHFRNQFKPTAFYLLLAVMVMGLGTTQSRGAYLAAVVGFVILTAYRQSIARALVMGIGAGALWFLLSVTIPSDSRIAATLGMSGHSIETAEYRRKLFQQGLSEVWANPLFGQDPKSLVLHMQNLVQGQGIVDFVNTHLYIAMTTGVTGFTLWIVIWVGSVVFCWSGKYGKWGRNGIYDPCELAVMMICVPMIGLTFTSMIDRNLTWPALGLGLIGPCLAMRESLKGTPFNKNGEPFAAASVPVKEVRLEHSRTG